MTFKPQLRRAKQNHTKRIHRLMKRFSHKSCVHMSIHKYSFITIINILPRAVKADFLELFLANYPGTRSADIHYAYLTRLSL